MIIDIEKEITKWPGNINGNTLRLKPLYSSRMKKLFTIFTTLFFAASIAAFAEESAPVSPAQLGSITVHIINLKEIKGMLRVSLYNSGKGFPGKHGQAYATAVKTLKVG